MYNQITGENAYETPMRIFPAVHYTMGGLWVDYNLHVEPPRPLCASGEANFSDHGANRLGASALMQGLADGYFVLPNTIGNYLAPQLRAASRRRSIIPSSNRLRAEVHAPDSHEVPKHQRAGGACRFLSIASSA